jgi:hypothetical protein
MILDLQVSKNAYPFSEGVYYVISRGNQGQEIFLDEKDLEIFFLSLSDFKTSYPFLKVNVVQRL